MVVLTNKRPASGIGAASWAFLGWHTTVPPGVFRMARRCSSEGLRTAVAAARVAAAFCCTPGRHFPQQHEEKGGSVLEVVARRNKGSHRQLLHRPSCGALRAGPPRRSCTGCSWPEGLVLLFLPFFYQSFCLHRPGPLSPHLLHKEKGLRPCSFPHSTPAGRDAHTTTPRSPGLWLHSPSALKSTAEQMLGFLFFREQDWCSLPA